MSGKIKGIIVEIGGDTSGLQRALSKVNSQSSSLNKELRAINSLLKLDPKNVEVLEQKQKVLNESIEITQGKLNQLKKVKEEADRKMAEGAEISEENYRNLQREIINTERKLGKLTEEMKQLNLANSNWTKAGKKIEEYGSKITKVSDKINDVGNKASIVSGAVIAGGTVLTNSAMNVEDAVAKYVNSTNTAQEETEKYKKVLEDISRNNYGESYEDIADAMSQVKVQLKDVNSQDLKNITEKAIALRDLFGYDVSESIRAVKSMMDNFNVSADEAFNLIAEGKKQGLDFSNELIDSVNEYSVQFKKLGLTADDMFNIFKSGAENGAFNLDKIGDAVKEFSIRAIDGSNTTVEGFKKIGLNADKMAKKFSKGGDEAKQAFKEVIQRIAKMDNKVEQSIVGVDLFGTMWEDLGPTVITSFSKMDRGISKSSNSMQKSIDGLYNTTKKKAEAQLKRLQALGADFGEEMLPILEKLIDKAEDFIGCIEGMSDAEKENLVHVGLLVAGIGPLTKVVGTTGQAIDNVTKGIGTFSQAIGVMKNHTKSGVATVDNLAKMLTLLNTPLGLLTTTTIIAGTALYAYDQKVMASAKAAKAEKEEIQKQIQAKKDLQEEQKKQITTSIAEIDNTNKLWNELKQITNENGKVKDGYTKRASFITNELSKALGIELELNGGIIKGYQGIQSEIDKTILKKKAEIYLQKEEENYKIALTEKESAYAELVKLQNQYNEAYKKSTYSGKDFWKAQEAAAAKIQLQELATAIKEQQSLLDDYNQGISKYEYDYQLMTTNTADSLQELINRNKIMLAGDTTTLQTELQNQIGLLQNKLNSDKQMYNQAIINRDESNKQAAINQINSDNEELKQLGKKLSSMTSTVESMTPKQVEMWRKLAQANKDIFNEIISDMPPDVQKELRNITGVINAEKEVPNALKLLGEQSVSNFDIEVSAMQGTTSNAIENAKSVIKNDSSLKLASQTLGQETTNKFKENINSTNGKSAMTDYIQGAENGANQKKGSFWNLIFGIGRKANQQMREGLGDGSPSVLAKRALIDYFLGADIGIGKQAPKTLKNIAKYSSKINKEFVENMKIPEVKDIGKLQGNLSSRLIDAQKTVFTTPEITFNVQELDEAKLQQCFNYVNKKFGSQY